MSEMTAPVVAEAAGFPLRGATRPAYFARPAGAGPFPGLIVIHEIYGLNENIREIAQRFAREGYAALAIDLFGGRNRTFCTFRIFSQLMLGSLRNATLDELRAALTWLSAREEVNAERVGAIGFCMGGSFAIAWACVDPRLKVIAPFYAMNPRPLEAVRRSCPVVGSYPDHDFTASAGRKLDQALTAAQIEHDIKLYPGAKHSFFNDQGQVFDPAASQDAWSRVLAFFGERIR
ncbi:MAG: dienelactone hydrolase family protein [Ktedonobacterales bacterium]